jgi:hypothetical protein
MLVPSDERKMMGNMILRPRCAAMFERSGEVEEGRTIRTSLVEMVSGSTSVRAANLQTVTSQHSVPPRQDHRRHRDDAISLDDHHMAINGNQS